MTVLYHPGFAGDIRRFARQYAEISPRLGARFRYELDAAIAAVRENPTAAGHFVHTGSALLRDVRRRNLAVFPFFVLYGLTENMLIFGALVPRTSDPATWLRPFRPEA